MHASKKHIPCYYIKLADVHQRFVLAVRYKIVRHIKKLSRHNWRYVHPLSYVVGQKKIACPYWADSKTQRCCDTE